MFGAMRYKEKGETVYMENSNLRVLIYSNPLVVDKISKKFIYWKDSGFIYTKHLISALPKNWKYYWLVPEKLVDEQWFKEANDNIALLEYPYSTSIHQNRYEFYGNVLKKNFPYTKDIDIVINNQPEVTTNLRVYFENQRRDNPLIFNFFHWIDCEESRQFGENLSGYFWRQYDGVLNADISYFHNNYALSLFEREINSKIKEITPFKSGYFHPPFTNFGHEVVTLSDNKIILFNHRLNNTTNWKFFLECADELRKTRKDFYVWFTDDSDKAKSKIIKRDYVINKSLPFESYGYLLEHSHFSVCTHKGYSTWNMAVIDALGKKCFTLVPETEKVYKHMFGEVDTEMYHDNTKNELVSKMKFLLGVDREFLRYKASRIIENFPEYFTNISQYNIKKDILETINERVNGFNKIAKYDKVKEYILKNKRVTKRELVNHFWSFHVNSNFQKIRWKLLSENIIQDDVQEDYTTYFAKED